MPTTPDILNAAVFATQSADILAAGVPDTARMPQVHPTIANRYNNEQMAVGWNGSTGVTAGDMFALDLAAFQAQVTAAFGECLDAWFSAKGSYPPYAQLDADSLLLNLSFWEFTLGEVDNNGNPWANDVNTAAEHAEQAALVVKAYLEGMRAAALARDHSILLTFWAVTTEGWDDGSDPGTFLPEFEYAGEAIRAMDLVSCSYYFQNNGGLDTASREATELRLREHLRAMSALAIDPDAGDTGEGGEVPLGGPKPVVLFILLDYPDSGTNAPVEVEKHRWLATLTADFGASIAIWSGGGNPTNFADLASDNVAAIRKAYADHRTTFWNPTYDPNAQHLSIWNRVDEMNTTTIPIGVKVVRNILGGNPWNDDVGVSEGLADYSDTLFGGRGGVTFGQRDRLKLATGPVTVATAFILMRTSPGTGSNNVTFVACGETGDIDMILAENADSVSFDGSGTKQGRYRVNGGAWTALGANVAHSFEPDTTYLFTLQWETDAAVRYCGQRLDSSNNQGGGSIYYLAYSTTRDDSMIQKYEGYIAHEAGADHLLDSEHPYKTTPPTLGAEGARWFRKSLAIVGRYNSR